MRNACVVRLGPLGRNSLAILRQASLLPLVSETLSYPPSSMTRFHRRKRSIWRLPTFGSRSRTVLHITLLCARGNGANKTLTRASRDNSPKCLGIPHVPGRIALMFPAVCWAPYCDCRIHLSVVQVVSRGMHGLGGASGAMAVVLVDARRASVAVIDEHQNAQHNSQHRAAGFWSKRIVT